MCESAKVQTSKGLIHVVPVESRVRPLLSSGRDFRESRIASDRLRPIVSRLITSAQQHFRDATVSCGEDEKIRITRAD